MNPTDRLALLHDLYREKLALFRRHQAGAERVSAYDGNNAYQYVLAREDAHLEWLRRAIAEAGGTPDDTAAAFTLPSAGAADLARAVADDDARTAAAFLARWRPRVAAMRHARDRKMLDLLMGEVAEHQRFFEQVAGGSLELLGRRPERAGTGGGVLPGRWVG